MAQIKIFGLDKRLNRIKHKLSDTIHSCVVEVLQMPEDKRFHRFFPLKEEDYFYAAGRTDAYTIIEISIFEGRSVEAKKQLISLLFSRIEAEAGILPNDVEITIFETPKHNWGIRGVPADELQLNYKINV